MLNYWINRLLGRPRIRVVGAGSGLLYRENHRTVQLAAAMLERGYGIFPSTIISWDDEPERLVSEIERRRIVDAVKAVIKSQWGEDTEVREME